MTNASTTAAKEGPLEIVREFDAPAEKLWKAWTDPAEFKKWWGPENFTTPEAQIDLKEGGKYLYCMRSPEAQDFWGTGIYREIQPNKKLVFSDNFADAEGNIVPPSVYGMTGDWADELTVTVNFEETDGKTRMTLRHEGLPEGEMKEMCGTGWNMSFDKLERLVR